MANYRQYLFTIIILYVGLNIIGLLPLNIFYESADFSNNYIVFFLGLAGLLIPLLFFKPGVEPDEYVPELPEINAKRLFSIFKCSLFVSFITIAYINIANGGIVILSNITRYNNNAVLTHLEEISIGVILVTYTANKIYNFNQTKFIYICTGAYIIGLLTLGYRTPIIVLLGAIGIINTIVNGTTILSKRLIFFGIIGIVAMSLIEQFRIAQDYDVYLFYKDVNFGFVKQHEWLLPLVPAISLFRYDQTVVNMLINKIGSNYMYGGLTAANFITILPGEQVGARNIIGQLIGARNLPGKDEAWSITPTLQGALYVDGGYLFVFIGFLIPAIIIYRLFRNINRNYSPGNIALAGYVFINIIKSLHSGYLDIDFFIDVIVIYKVNTMITLPRNYSPQTLGYEELV